jgi:hypothetical protein
MSVRQCDAQGPAVQAAAVATVAAGLSPAAAAAAADSVSMRQV